MTAAGATGLLLVDVAGLPPDWAWRRVGGSTLLRRGLAALAGATQVTSLRVLVSERNLPRVTAELAAEPPPLPYLLAAGAAGAPGLAQCLAGVDSATVIGLTVSWPLAQPRLIDALAGELAGGAPAAVAVRPVTDTLKRLAADGRVTETVDRDGWLQVQLPWAATTAGAKRLAEIPDWSDLATALALTPGCVRVPGEPASFEARSADDLQLAEALIADAAAGPPASGRTGR